jgi:hypothetical protein
MRLGAINYADSEQPSHKSTMTTKTILVANPKGGVGKSLTTILAIEFFLMNKVPLEIVDADDNRTVENWRQFCGQKGRSIRNAKKPQLRIIDSAGLPSAMQTFLQEADVILAPYKSFTPDVARLIGWYRDDLPTDVRNKLCVFPNMLPYIHTKDQRKGMETMRALLDVYGNLDRSLPALAAREGIYGRLFNGHPENFFDRKDESQSFKNAQEEATALFNAFLPFLG